MALILIISTAEEIETAAGIESTIKEIANNKAIRSASSKSEIASVCKAKFMVFDVCLIKDCCFFQLRVRMIDKGQCYVK